jgi:hypothetical protein
MYNKILQINNVNKTSKRLKNDVDIENHRIIQPSVELQTPFRFILVGLMNMIMVCSLVTKFFDRHNVYFWSIIFQRWPPSIMVLMTVLEFWFFV